MVRISGASTSRSALRYIEMFNFYSTIKVTNNKETGYNFEDYKLLILLLDYTCTLYFDYFISTP